MPLISTRSLKCDHCPVELSLQVQHGDRIMVGGRPEGWMQITRHGAELSPTIYLCPTHAAPFQVAWAAAMKALYP